MKQHITIEQWDEISEDQKERYDEVGNTFERLPNIGQMIEFLNKHDHFNTAYTLGKSNKVRRNRTFSWEYSEELCDVLWEDVKERLKGKREEV